MCYIPICCVTCAPVNMMPGGMSNPGNSEKRHFYTIRIPTVLLSKIDPGEF